MNWLESLCCPSPASLEVIRKEAKRRSVDKSALKELRLSLKLVSITDPVDHTTYWWLPLSRSSSPGEPQEEDAQDSRVRVVFPERPSQFSGMRLSEKVDP